MTPILMRVGTMTTKNLIVDRIGKKRVEPLTPAEKEGLAMGRSLKIKRPQRRQKSRGHGQPHDEPSRRPLKIKLSQTMPDFLVKHLQSKCPFHELTGEGVISPTR